MHNKIFDYLTKVKFSVPETRYSKINKINEVVSTKEVPFLHVKKLSSGGEGFALTSGVSLDMVNTHLEMIFTYGREGSYGTAITSGLEYTLKGTDGKSPLSKMLQFNSAEYYKDTLSFTNGFNTSQGSNSLTNLIKLRAMANIAYNKGVLHDENLERNTVKVEDFESITKEEINEEIQKLRCRL